MTVSYDPDLRHDTPLALKLKARIRATGPMLFSDYMDACLFDPECGYYVTQPVIGADGDFITAPEISQVFGELIGLWAVTVWRQMGRPSAFTLIELGGGRGVLMEDALRAASRVDPAFMAAMKLVMYEGSPRFRTAQAERLRAHAPDIREHVRYTDGPAIVIGNEFLDCLSVNVVDHEDRTRLVGLDAEDRLIYVRSERARDASWGHGLKPGEVREFSSAWHTVQTLLGNGQRDSAALFIDYGYEAATSGETVQAIRRHAYEHPLTSPGEADLSAFVNFSDVAQRAPHIGLAVDGPVTQAEFLGALGIMERASRLIATNPARANEIETGVARLMAPNGMGTRFKVLGVRSPQLPPLPGFRTR